MTRFRSLLPASARSYAGGAFDPYLDGRIPPPGFDGNISTAGSRVTADSALTLIDAYSCVALLVDDVSQLPIDTFRKEGAVRTPIDPVQLIAEPDPDIEQWEWIARIVGSLATRGNAYGYLYDWDRRGYPQRCRILNSDDVTPRRNRGTGNREYHVRDAELGYAILPPSQILHIPLVVIGSDIAGLSPIHAARRGLGLSMAVEEFGARFFGDGATPSSVLETDQSEDQVQAKVIQARWMASHGGRRRPAVLTSGLKWKPVTIAPNESQFLETRKLNTDQVARIWRIPPHMIGNVDKTTSWGRGIEEQGIGYVVHTLGPYLSRIEAALSSKRMSPRGQYIKFNVAALLRGNTKDRFLSYAIGRQWGWYCVDDIRSLEDLPPLPNGQGQTFLQPLNMVDADKALQILLSNSNDSGGASDGGGDGGDS